MGSPVSLLCLWLLMFRLLVSILCVVVFVVVVFCVCLCLFVFLSVCLSVYLPVCLSGCDFMSSPMPLPGGTIGRMSVVPTLPIGYVTHCFSSS